MTERESMETEKAIDVFRDILSPLVLRLHGADKKRLHDLFMESMDCCLLEYALDTTGNQLAASELLGISRNTLRRKMEKYGMDDTSRPHRNRRKGA
jgi:Fis family transcriptional regulator